MRALIVSVLSLLFFSVSYAQNNTIFVELGGNSLGPSLNYQRQLGHDGRLGLRIGVGSAYVTADYVSNNPSYFSSLLPDERLCIPISINYLINLKQRNYLEAGLGYTWIDFKKDFQNSEQGTHNLILSIGYLKKFGARSGWMWRANFTPLIGGKSGNGFVFGFSPMAGVSIGKHF
jgi:hypothetical protein